MFKHIDYEVTFAATPHRAAQHFKRHHDFSRGFTAITGGNEQGKSLILEFLRFLMFGTGALRGPASGYGSLKVSGEVVIKGETYAIERTISKAKLSHEGAVIVTGAKPVNQKIVSLLGFGLDVFDVSNSINQGDVERLGAMRPAERQRLVDSVVGLDKIEALTKWANDNALGFEREAAGIDRTIVDLVAPIEPERWAARDDIKIDLAKAEADQLTLATIDGELRAPQLAKPDVPTLTVTESEADLRASMFDRAALASIDYELRNLLPAIDVPAAQAAAEAWDKFCVARDFLNHTREPLWSSKEELDAEMEQLEVNEAWIEHRAHEAKVARLRHSLDCADKMTCPSCEHEFVLDAETFANQQAQMDALDRGGVAPSGSEAPTRPRNKIQADLGNWPEIERTLKGRREAAAVPPAVMPTIRAAELPRYVEDAQRRAVLEEKRFSARVVFIDDEQGKLVTLQVQAAALAGYQGALAAYETQQARRAELEQQRLLLANAPLTVQTLRPVVAAFGVYASALEHHEAQEKVQAVRRAEVATLMAKGQGWRRAREALVVLRSSIKQHLYPSLARAASFYITGMTGGARRIVEISEGFDILVDGQGLDTLSGSAKAVANLSVRLGLGRVLTHGVFAVVLADEIDASMDDYRAGKTADSLQQCSVSIDQLLLVSHKTPEADNYIRLGDTSEQPSVP